MKHAGTHSHMWLIGVVAVSVLLWRYGVGWALALALLACGAMLVAILLFKRSPPQQPHDRTEHRDDLHH